MANSNILIDALLTHPLVVKHINRWSKEMKNQLHTELTEVSIHSDVIQYLESLLSRLSKYVPLGDYELDFVPATLDLNGVKVHLPITTTPAPTLNTPSVPTPRPPFSPIKLRSSKSTPVYRGEEE